MELEVNELKDCVDSSLSILPAGHSPSGTIVWRPRAK